MLHRRDTVRGSDEGRDKLVLFGEKKGCGSVSLLVLIKKMLSCALSTDGCQHGTSLFSLECIPS